MWRRWLLVEVLMTTVFEYGTYVQFVGSPQECYGDIGVVVPSPSNWEQVDGEVCALWLITDDPYDFRRVRWTEVENLRPIDPTEDVIVAHLAAMGGIHT